MINDYEYKLIQFADNITLFLDGSRGSLLAALNISELFRSLSGLIIFAPSDFSCHMPSIKASGSIEWSHDLYLLRLQVDH